MKVSVYSIQEFEKDIFVELNQTMQHELTYIQHHLSHETKDALVAADAVCCFVSDIITAPVIDALKAKGVKLIALRSAGFNHVDVAYAKQQGITVCRVPAYSPYAVAEHAVGLVLSLNRHIHRAHNRVRELNFSLHGLMGFDLHGCTVGVIGTGKIGKVFSKIMLGFGTRVIAYDIQPDAECQAMGVEYLPLAEVFKHADILSLHCPLNSNTKHIIDANSIQKMKDNVMLINTSRGALIDTAAVIQALKHHKIGYLGMDVYEEEEHLFFEDHSDEIIDDDLFARLQSFPNVLITGHQAFFTKEAVHNIVQTTLDNITNFEQGQGEVFVI